MNNYGIKFLGHNIPKVLPENFSSIFGFRIQNISGKIMHFYNRESAFYGNLSHEHTYRIFVFINEKIHVNALIFEDVIHSGKIATVFFPFQTSGRGSYHLKIIITTGKDTKEILKYAHTLLDLFVNVRKNVLSVRINRMMSQNLFKMLYSEIPIQFQRLQLRIYKTLFHFYNHLKSKKSECISRLKYNNKKLAFMEKQVRKQKVNSFPCYIGIDTTTKCNLHCISCFRNYVDINFNEIPDMSEDVLNRLILELFPTALTLNISTIGEPLLSPHIEKILDACLEYHVCLAFTTNGTLLKGNVFLDKLVKVLHHIEISFDSASPELFEKLRPNSRYSEVLQNAKNLGKIRSTMMGNKFNLGFSMTLFRENLTEIPEVLRIISDIGGNFLKTDFGVIFTKQDLTRSVTNYPDLYNEIYHISQEEAQKVGIRLLMRSPFLENGHSYLYNKGICDYLYLSACINSQGELKPCYLQAIPSLKVNKKFITMWNNKMMQSLRLEHDSSKKQNLCRDCYLIIQGKDTMENRKKQFLQGDALNG